MRFVKFGDVPVANKAEKPPFRYKLVDSLISKSSSSYEKQSNSDGLRERFDFPQRVTLGPIAVLPDCQRNNRSAQRNNQRVLDQTALGLTQARYASLTGCQCQVSQRHGACHCNHRAGPLTATRGQCRARNASAQHARQQSQKYRPVWRGLHFVAKQLAYSHRECPSGEQGAVQQDKVPGCAAAQKPPQCLPWAS